MRLIISKINPPQLRPILLHFFNHVDAQISNGMNPHKERIESLEAENKILINRMNTMETDQSTFRELYSITEERQRRTEQTCKDVSQKLERLIENQEWKNENVQREILQLNTKIRELEIALAKQSCYSDQQKLHQKSVTAFDPPTKTISPPPPPPAVEKSHVVIKQHSLNEIEMQVEKHVARGLGILAEEIIKVQDTLSKLKRIAIKSKKRQTNLHSTLSAEFVSLLDTVKILKHETNDLKAYSSVNYGTIKAEMEILRDDFTQLQRGSDFDKIKRFWKENMKKYAHRIQVIANHQVHLGETVELLARR